MLILILTHLSGGFLRGRELPSVRQYHEVVSSSPRRPTNLWLGAKCKSSRLSSELRMQLQRPSFCKSKWADMREAKGAKGGGGSGTTLPRRRTKSGRQVLCVGCARATVTWRSLSDNSEAKVLVRRRLLPPRRQPTRILSPSKCWSPPSPRAPVRVCSNEETLRTARGNWEREPRR